MVIQNFTLNVHKGVDRKLVYQGTTQFGFFSDKALNDQKGLGQKPAAGQYLPKGLGIERSQPWARSPWCQLQQLLACDWQSGAFGHGYLAAGFEVDPSAWYFNAHVKGDPVMPGSMGLEAFWHLLKLAAASRWHLSSTDRVITVMGENSHKWMYRGQITKRNKNCLLEMHIKSCDDKEKTIVADGYLSIDELIIYKVEDFAVRLV